MRRRHHLALLLAFAALAACARSAPAAPPTPAAAATPAPAPSPIRTTPAPTAPSLSFPNVDPASLGGTLVIDGSSTVFPISELAAAAFRSFAPQVEIQLGVSGTGGGFAKFCAGETVISAASRPIKQSEAAACAAAGIGYIELPVAFDGISLVVHPSNSWARCITVAELRRLWEPAAAGTITRWSQIRPGWPDSAIHLYGAGSDSGTYDYFTSAVVGSEGASRADYTASEDDYLLAQDLAADPAGFGFFGYSYYVEYDEQLRAVAIDGGAGCVAPSQASIADGSYQPLARPIFIYVRADALERPELLAFVSFYLANGPALVRQARYIPLPERAYALAARRLERRLTGSVFAGGSQVGVSIEQLLELEGK